MARSHEHARTVNTARSFSAWRDTIIGRPGQYLDEDESWTDSITKHPQHGLLYVDKPVDIRSKLHISSRLHMARALFVVLEMAAEQGGHSHRGSSCAENSSVIV
jgi:hypothetical protein